MPLKDHLNKLEYFHAIVDNQSLLKASYKLGISQPQLSRVLKILENDLDKQLLVRTPAGIEPTIEGMELYKLTTNILQIITSGETRIKHKESRLKGTLKIGTYDSIARYFFPSFLKYLKSASPGMKIFLETARSSTVFTKVRNGSLDIGIGVAPKNNELEDLDVEHIYSDSFGFYHHPSISTDFLDQLIIFPKSANLKDDQEKKFSKTHKFSSSILSDNLETVKSLSEEGVGVGFLPHRVAREAVLQGKLIPQPLKKRLTDLFPHSVVICKSRNNNNRISAVITQELHRFLSSWSKT